MRRRQFESVFDPFNSKVMDNLDGIIEKYLQNREKEEQEKEFDWIPVPMSREEKMEAMKLLTEGFKFMIDTSEYENSI